MNRGEQRKKYDKLRQVEIPKNGYKMVIFNYNEFEHTKGKKLLRNKGVDLNVIIKKLKGFINK
jgi:predicted RNA-binding protein associated with RNAse of E/G family